MLRYTEFKKYSWDKPLKYSDRFFFIGSCFTNHLSQYLSSLKFNVIANPFGNVYNPFSLVEQFFFLTGDMEYDRGLDSTSRYHFHWSMHSDVSGKTKGLTSTIIEDKIEVFRNWKYKTGRKIVVVTLGTSWVYKKCTDNSIVGNCHKYPSNYFTKEILSLGEIVEKLRSGLECLQQFLDGEVEFIFTVSPVRYLRDGFVENQRSKSRLLLAVESICKTCNNVAYFPSYELFMDDLRDYRYSDKDFVHPNELAVEYIRGRFGEWCFDNDTQYFMSKIIKVKLAMEHVISKRASKEDIASFTHSHLKILDELERINDSIDLTVERNHFISLAQKI